MSTVQIRTVCPHDCPDQCSMLATVEDGRLTRVTGDPANPFTQTWLCGKVSKYPERVYSPERLLTPLRRVGSKGSGRFAPVSWDEALGEVAHRWKAIIADHGPQALLGYAYSGHMGLINRNLPRALFHALGATQMLIGTVCDSTCEAGWEYAVGATPGSDPETAVDSDLIIAWSANLATTSVHFLPVVDRARAKGAQLVVIDPYRNRTARRADWHIAPRVGTDAALALGLMHVLAREGFVDMDFIGRRTVGFTALRDQVLPSYSPERAAEITGVPAGDIERLARLYGQARAPFLRVGMGMSRHAYGGMAIRTVACLPALVGAWERPGGGALMDTAAAWSFDYNAIRRPDLLKGKARVVNHTTLGRDLLEQQDPPIMGLFVAANNPAVTCPDQERVIRGLSREDLFTVVHDVTLSDTARCADLVLPACTALETEDFYRSYGTYYTQYSPAVIPPVGQSRSNFDLVQELARRMELTDPVFRRTPRELMAEVLRGASGATAELSLEAYLEGGPVRLNYPARGPELTRFYSEPMAEDGLPPLPEWKPDPAEAAEAARWPLRLLTAPGHSQHHTAFGGVESLQKLEGPPRCILHPDDAARRGVQDGDAVAIFNHRGHVGLHARVSTDVIPGAVVVEGQRSRARYLSGGPLNILTGDGLTDMGKGATYQSTFVDLRPLAGG